MTKTQIRRNIKSNAKKMLRGSFGTAALAILIYLLVLFGTSFLTNAVMNTLGLNATSNFLYNPQENPFSNSDITSSFDWVRYFVSLGLSFVSMLITIPLSFGMMEWYIRLSEGTKKPLSSIFDWFSTAKHYFKSIGVSLNVTLRTMLYVGLPAVLCSIVFFALGAYLLTAEGDVQQLTALLYIGAVLLFAVVIILLSIFSLRYALCAYLCIRFPAAKIRLVIRESIAIMKGHKAELFVFGLSFLPWVILSFFTFGLLFVWLAPYMMAAMTIFYNYVYDVAKAAGVGSAEFPPYTVQETNTDSSVGEQNEMRLIEGDVKPAQSTWEQLIEKQDDGENPGHQ